nr:VAN3-binding protein-like [Ipomoea batatas]
MAVASAAMLVAAQCVETAEAMGADRDHLMSAISSAVNVRSHGDISTLTAAAATALRGAATLKARALKEVWNMASVIPSDEVAAAVGRGGKGDLHWKIVSVYIHRSGEVVLKMKSKHVANTITKKKKRSLNLLFRIKDASIFPMDFTLLCGCVATGGLLGGGRVGNVLRDSSGDGAEQ